MVKEWLHIKSESVTTKWKPCQNPANTTSSTPTGQVFLLCSPFLTLLLHPLGKFHCCVPQRIHLQHRPQPLPRALGSWKQPKRVKQCGTKFAWWICAPYSFTQWSCRHRIIVHETAVADSGSKLNASARTQRKQWLNMAAGMACTWAKSPTRERINYSAAAAPTQ